MSEKEKAALGLMIESVLKPDSKLRGCAHNQNCYDELMIWREKMLEFFIAMTKTDFETVWWEMEEIEPLTPIINLRNETNEIPSPVRQAQEERLRNS